MSILIKNIKGLVQVREKSIKWLAGKEMGDLPVIEDAFLYLKGDKIGAYGPMKDFVNIESDQTIDATGKFVLPCFVDSHTHIVYAASRESEFVEKIRGVSYEEIAKRGGGILNSAVRLQQTDAEDLYQSSLERVREVIGFGTGALEIKSGYGLTLEDEIKMLKVARRIGQETPLTVKTTFLGAHAIPHEYRERGKYIDLIIQEMIPRIAEENLADFCDVFCEEGFFTPEETEDILEAGKKYGLKPKVHANQLHRSGGVQIGVKTGAISVDHLETIGTEEIEALNNTNTIPTLLPGSVFFLGNNYPPARKMIESGLPVAIATDYNPGSAPCGKMSFMLSLACIKMKMTPEEAINAVTVNTAYAMEIGDILGSITKDKIANIIITREIPSIEFIPYAFGSDIVETVILNGQIVDNLT